ncbi:MAG: CZB domain-containing protein [Nitrospira sp.]|nr:CZB domain-containing protein [Nitrospira sp.]
MIQKEEITKAISAHGLWKTRLSQAIATGKTDVTVATVRMDHQCAFGKWLYGPTLDAKDKLSSHYKEVLRLHAQFHEKAAQVLELAMAGKKQEAQQLMALDGDYAKASSQLTAAMTAWLKSLAA